MLILRKHALQLKTDSTMVEEKCKRIISYGKLRQTFHPIMYGGFKKKRKKAVQLFKKSWLSVKACCSPYTFFIHTTTRCRLLQCVAVHWCRASLLINCIIHMCPGSIVLPCVEVASMLWACEVYLDFAENRLCLVP